MAQTPSRLSGYVPSAHVVRAALKVAKLLGRASQSLETYRHTLAHVPTDGLFTVESLLDGEEFLVRAGIAERTEDEIFLLTDCLVEQGSTAALYTRYLAHNPPPWLGAATRKDDFDAAMLPPADGEALTSLFGSVDRRNAILLALGQKYDDAFRRELGLAGELHVLAECEAILEAAGRPELCDDVVHVSRVSDALGYDIETPTTHRDTRRLEVKTSAGAADPVKVYLTRNEWKTALVDPLWRLVVCVRRSPTAFETIGWTTADELAPLLPVDGEMSYWQTAVLALSWNRLSRELSGLIDV